MIPGDFLIIRVNATELSPDLLEFLEQVRPIGVHFGRDAFHHDQDYFSWIEQFRTLRSNILQATQREKMIWAIDHEGGRVHRVPEPITHFPYPLNWEVHSGAVGRIVGKELQSLGMNLLFGPSLDIFSNETNKVIGPRSFGRSAPLVDEFSSQFIEGVEKEDVLATVKHFPGHGDTEEDSHFELPILRLSTQKLSERELLPFQYAINGGIRAVMLAHILFPEIDQKLPASLSPEIAKGLLREQLSFTGVSITDDLDMQAIRGKFSPIEIANSIVECETNFAIFNHSLEHASSVADELQKRIDLGETPLQTIHERSIMFLTALADPDVQALSDSTLQEHQELCHSIPDSYQVEIQEFTGA